MTFVQADENEYQFSEITENDNQVTITNSSGRKYLNREIVQEGGYVGEVREYDGIDNAGTGKINIFHERKVRTAQIEVTDTFVVGQTIYFLAGGSSAAGKIRATPEAGSVPIGICTAEGGTGGAQTYVEYRPFSQGSGAQAGSGVMVEKIVVPAGSHGAGTPVVNTNIPVGAEIMDVEVRATATVGSATVTVSNGTNDITDAIAMATVDAMTKAGTIDTTYGTIIAAGLTLTANGASDEGIVYVYYKR